MKQIASNYSYSPTTNVVTLTGVNIDADQLLLIVAPQVGRTMYNFASVTGVVSAGANTRVTLNAATAGLTTTSPLVIFYDDQASTQTIAGTVTANGSRTFVDPNAVTVSGFLTVGGWDDVNSQHAPIPLTEGGMGVKVGFDNVNGNPLQVINHASVPLYATVTIGNTVTIGSLPVNLSTTTIGGTARLNVTLSSATTVGNTAPSFANLYGGSDGTNLRAISVDSSGRTVVTVANTVPVSISSVTIGAMPNGTLTTRFGSVTTANTAFATAAVTNSSRKYLLIQNVTTGSNVITVGIGFTPTTTQGIQLTAGAGITFESSYIPTGAVQILSSVTASNFTILEA